MSEQECLLKVCSPSASFTSSLSNPTFTYEKTKKISCGSGRPVSRDIIKWLKITVYHCSQSLGFPIKLQIPFLKVEHG